MVYPNIVLLLPALGTYNFPSDLVSLMKHFQAARYTVCQSRASRQREQRALRV